MKQTVMTSVYGVTYVGAREQIKRRLEEKGLIDDDRLLFTASCYAAKVSIDCLILPLLQFVCPTFLFSLLMKECLFAFFSDSFIPTFPRDMFKTTIFKSLRYLNSVPSQNRTNKLKHREYYSKLLTGFCYLVIYSLLRSLNLPFLIIYVS